MWARGLLCLAMIAGCAPRTRILVANIVTLDPRRPRARAVAIRDGRIVAVGSLAEARAAAPGARETHLEGATILPGLGDAHGHLASLGRKLSQLDVSAARSETDLVRLAARHARRLPRGAWVLGRGWDQTRWPGGRFPHHGALSLAVPDRPVLLRRVDGHAALVNAAAMRLAGIGAGTPDPPGGRILRDERGAPTGVLLDAAMDLVRPPPPSGAELREQLRAAARRCAAAGLTQVHEMGLEAAELAALRDLEARGELPLRVVVYLWAADERGLEQAVALARARDGRVADGWRVLVRGVKLILDGALGSRGAALLDPYRDDPANRGLLRWPVTSFRRAIDRIARAALQPAVHAIGDRAVALTLEAFERWPARLLPPRVEHLQLLPARATLEGRRLVASMQPSHATSDMRWAEARLGRERAGRAYAWRRVSEAGVVLAFGSDFPVEDLDPLRGLYAAVTRADERGQPTGGWFGDQRLDRERALRAYTEGVAAAAGLRPAFGRIEPGAVADLSAFDRDISRVPARELLAARAVGTWLGGERVR